MYDNTDYSRLRWNELVEEMRTRGITVNQPATWRLSAADIPRAKAFLGSNISSTTWEVDGGSGVGSPGRYSDTITLKRDPLFVGPNHAYVSECPECGGKDLERCYGPVTQNGIEWRVKPFWSCDDCLWTTLPKKLS